MQEHMRRSNMLVYQGTSYCSKLKIGAKPLSYWPPVFQQDNPYK